MTNISFKQMELLLNEKNQFEFLKLVGDDKYNKLYESLDTNVL